MAWCMIAWKFLTYSFEWKYRKIQKRKPIANLIDSNSMRRAFLQILTTNKKIRLDDYSTTTNSLLTGSFERSKVLWVIRYGWEMKCNEWTKEGKEWELKKTRSRTKGASRLDLVGRENHGEGVSAILAARSTSLIANYTKPARTMRSKAKETRSGILIG